MNVKTKQKNETTKRNIHICGASFISNCKMFSDIESKLVKNISDNASGNVSSGQNVFSTIMKANEGTSQLSIILTPDYSPFRLFVKMFCPRFYVVMQTSC